MNNKSQHSNLSNTRSPKNNPIKHSHSSFQQMGPERKEEPSKMEEDEAECQWIVEANRGRFLKIFQMLS